MLTQQPSCSLMIPSQQSSMNPQRSGQLSGQSSSQPLHQNKGIFNEARDFSAMGTFVESNITYNNTLSSQFMKEFLNETIPGAAFDSSARDPPPRCHPGTRLAVLKRCIDFINSCDGEKKMRWVVGAAGVGKSAIMQSVAESPKLPVTSHASVFFSVNGRNDGAKAIKTLSYQLAAKSEPYRQLVEREITRDPSLFQSSMAVQFNRFIVEPFIHDSQLNSAGRVLVIIDGLDECDKTRTQQELLRLISEFCAMYPSSPLVWLIASRPEPHISSFFSRAKVMPTYEKEEILVDSDEGREDVERFLRHELTEIKETSGSLDPDSQWPEESDLWKIADAAGGLFAYGDTVVKYIGDSSIGDPALQLSDVLHVIDNHPLIGVPRAEHPMALLDALYARILSKVPSKIMINTRKILLQLATDWGNNLSFEEKNFVVLGNWLALTPDEAYAAVNHLRSVLRVPGRDEAQKVALIHFHKSFIDYLSDFNRSEFSRNIIHDARQSNTQYAKFRILNEAPDGIDFGKIDYRFHYGRLRRVPGIGCKITLTWRVHERGGWSDNETRSSVYKLAVGEVVAGIMRREPIFQSGFSIRLLAKGFKSYGSDFPCHTLCGLVFNESLRHDFLVHRILKQVPLMIVDVSGIVGYFDIDLKFRCPPTTVIKDSNPSNFSCKHKREGKWEKGTDQDWATTFDVSSCGFCFRRFEQQLDSWKTQCPDHMATILPTSTGLCCMEIKITDVMDGSMSEWTYRFWYELRRLCAEGLWKVQ